MNSSRYQIDFFERLEGIDPKTLEESANSIYALDADFNFIYFNPSYIRFAEENNYDGDILKNYPIGSSLNNIIKDEKLLNIYRKRYLNSITYTRHWSCEYECSSKETFRKYHQLSYPIKGKFMIIVNSLVAEMPMDQVGREIHEPDQQTYRQLSGYIQQCSNCRRTQRSIENEQWDWVPEYITKPPENTSHSICPICFDYHWKYQQAV